jgi:hypothetical protein
MSAYNELPDEFKSYWIQSKIYELYYFTNVVKKFEKNGNKIHIYDLDFVTMQRIKEGQESNYRFSLKYNISINNYELINNNKSVYKKYTNYKDVLDDLWKINN